MELMLLRIFQRHVADQCHFALSAVPLIEVSLDRGDHETLWIGCQQFLVGAANVSKALWGQGGKLSDQREALRISLEVDDDSELRATTFRNHFEHYDNRIDTWWQESISHNHLDKMIGPPEASGGLDAKDQFRIYDPASHRIIFWGQEFFVPPIAAALGRLHPLAEAAARKPHWDPEAYSGN